MQSTLFLYSVIITLLCFYFIKQYKVEHKNKLAIIKSTDRVISDMDITIQNQQETIVDLSSRLYKVNSLAQKAKDSISQGLPKQPKFCEYATKNDILGCFELSTTLLKGKWYCQEHYTMQSKLSEEPIDLSKPSDTLGMEQS